MIVEDVPESDGCPCGAPDEETYFDRSLCPEPCGAMHTRCSWCGRVLDGCVLGVAA